MKKLQFLLLSNFTKYHFKMIWLSYNPYHIMKSVSGIKTLISRSNFVRSLRFFSQTLEPIDPKKLPTNYTSPSNFDPSNHRPPPTPRVWSIVDDVAALTISEVAELSQILITKMGLRDPPNIAIMGAGGGPGGSAAAGKSAEKEALEEKKEKTVFELKLEVFDAASKIKVIKEVRGFTELGLKEAKELVEKAPVVINGGVSKEEGEKIIEKMKAVGAKIVLA